MRFDAAIRVAQYDDVAGVWRLRLKSGATVSSRAVISAVGALHLPAFPVIKGLELFQGRAFHSSAWDETFDLAGKSVGVIGTGASAVQITPSIAPLVKQLALFQRTPSWILPRRDSAFSARARRRFRSFPVLQWLFRHLIYWRMEMGVLGFLGNHGLMQQIEKMALTYLERSIPDEKLRAALTPDYAIGCKRILVSDDFYAAMTRNNVELVTEPISEATSDGIVTTDGSLRKLDALIYATGFRANDLLSEVAVMGRGGRRLSDDWRAGAEAYYGIAVSGYPNFFMLLGPNTGLGHNSIIFMIEAQVRYTMDCLGWLLRDGAGDIEVRADVQRKFNDALKQRMSRTVWQSGCKSWYLNENGTNSTIWPDHTVGYWWRTRYARKADFALRQAVVPAKA